MATNKLDCCGFPNRPHDMCGLGTLREAWEVVKEKEVSIHFKSAEPAAIARGYSSLTCPT